MKLFRKILPAFLAMITEYNELTMRYIKIFLLLLLSFSDCLSMAPASFVHEFNIGNFGNIAPGAAMIAAPQLTRIGDPVAAVGLPLDIDAWDQALPSGISDETFPVNAFGIAGFVLNNQFVIRELFNLFREYRNIAHSAVARVVIIDDVGNRFCYSIPYIFTSSATSRSAITSFNNGVPANNINYDNLRNALGIGHNNFLNMPAAPITNRIRTIGDYSFDCSQGQYQNYAHSERALGICLLYDPAHSIEHIVTAAIGNANYVAPIQQIIIQIKIAHEKEVCSQCTSFFNDGGRVVATAWSNPKYQFPNNFQTLPIVSRGALGTLLAVAPNITFTSGTNNVCCSFSLREHLADKSGVNVNNIHIRVSLFQDSADPRALPVLGPLPQTCTQKVWGF